MKSMMTIFLLICSLQIVAQKKSPLNYVDPFIGTLDMGHTFPGATAPFGFVQLSPETEVAMYSYGDGYNKEVYKYCAGYQYDDNTIVGFTHTHFNGTGHSDLGDLLIIPTTGSLNLSAGTEGKPGEGYRSRFSHKRESAEPGYYSVMLDDYKIKAELTASERVGFHRYTFPKSDSAHLIIDLTSGIYNYDGKIVWSSLRLENDTLITGHIQTNGWARSRQLFFAIALSNPVKNYGFLNEEDLMIR